MAGAIAVHAPIYGLVVRRRGAPRFARAFAIPTRRDLDLRLLVGAAVFGVGWGLAGFCPGPAVASLGASSGAVWWVVGAMLAGMAAGRFMDARSNPRPVPA
jgi:uncharacterized membrane protein YedE/YeeE